MLWGIVGEKLGWMKVVRWFGCIGMAVSTLCFYYLPQHFGHNFYMAWIPAILLGIFVAAFVPMTAVFTTLEPNHKGAAISIYNLSAGMSDFLAPTIATIFRLTIALSVWCMLMPRFTCLLLCSLIF